MSFLDRRQWLVRIQYCARSAFALTKGKILLTYSTLTPPCLEFDSDEKTKAITKKRSRGCIYTQHYCANEAGDRIKEIKINVANIRAKQRLETATEVQENKKRQRAEKLGEGPRDKICHLQPCQGFCRAIFSRQAPLAAPKLPEAAGCQGRHYEDAPSC